MADSIRKRTGNDISVVIKVIEANGQAIVDLSSWICEVYLSKRFGRRTKVDDVSITPESGQLSFTWKASQQSGCGEWAVLLRMTKSDGSGRSIDRVQAVTLTEHTCQSTDDYSNIAIGFTI